MSKITLRTIGSWIVVFVILVVFMRGMGFFIDNIASRPVCFLADDAYYFVNGVMYLKQIPVACAKLDEKHRIPYRQCFYSQKVGDIEVKNMVPCPVIKTLTI